MSGRGLEADSAHHPDVAAEQSQIDHAYACLRAMHERAAYVKSLGYLGGDVGEGGPTPDARAKWEEVKYERVLALVDPETALCFGRIDRRDGERFYIGRRHVEDGDGEPVVTDWRATVATPFYRATVVDPMGLAQRRRFLIEGRELIDILDEDLENPSSQDAGAYVPDPLLAEVGRARTGEMRDIVATIQAEQDVIIRAPIEECVVVQGGPGTGKTAVGLHRVAFLLYTHREALERQRVLIIGPNPVFFRYISQVLPSLGETAAIQLTIEGLAGRFRLRAEDRPEVARLKGDPRMVQAVRRAVFDRIGAPADGLRFSTAFGPIALPATEVADLMESALASPRPTNDSRNVVRQRLVDAAWRVYAARPTTDAAEWATFVDSVRASAEFKRVLDKVWPTMTARDLVRRLYGNAPLLRRATEGLLTDDERGLLARKASARVKDEQWTRADLGVLDEADALITGVANTYGHVVVDEAQDLSTLELRMVARRSRRGSMTILGDLAQATAPACQSSWNDVIEHIGAPTIRYDELTVGYRVPEPILAFANRLLPEAAPGVRATTSARVRGEAPSVLAVGPTDRASEAASEALQLARTWSSVGVVAPQSLIDDVADALRTANVDFVDSRRTASLGEHITLLLPSTTKGLEFDAVLAVEPGRIATEAANGLRLLYVVLTRAVQHLTVLHSESLPTALTP